MDMQTIVGWREWIAVPDLGIHRLYAKLDSGANTCSLHALNVEPLETCEGMWVRFRLDVGGTPILAPLTGWRRVKDSGGHVTLRPTIQTDLWLGGRKMSVEFTLADRSRMKHRLIIGRRALSNGYLIDSCRTCLHEPLEIPDLKTRLAALRSRAEGKKVRAAGFEPAIP